MKLVVNSDQEFVLNTVVQMLKEKYDYSIDQFDSTIDFAITELAKIQLRTLAQSGDINLHEGKDVLENAIDDVSEKIQQRIPQFKLNKKYRKSLQELKYSVFEIVELTSELSQSKENKRIGNRVSLPSTVNNSYEIVEIGLAGHIEGLLARPLTETFVLDLDNLKSKYFTINGEWFPYEVSRNEFVFTVDDDGSVYISTENFPESLMSEAKSQLEGLVTSLC